MSGEGMYLAACGFARQDIDLIEGQGPFILSFYNKAERKLRAPLVLHHRKINNFIEWSVEDEF